jgi:L-malate glycosyltransferase
LRILWIVNTIFPEPSKILDLQEPVVGGWLYSLAEQLLKNKHITLSVATVYRGDDFKCLNLNGIIYYLLPSKKTTGYQQHLEPYWKNICEEFNPDIIHIHGTEFNHGLSCMRVCNKFNYVVSIQGLVSICSRYYYANLSVLDVIKNVTFRDIIRHDTIFHCKHKFKARGIYEEEYIRKTKHIIGRTDWDNAHVKAINPLVNYHHCDEVLRDGFYISPKWNCKEKNSYSIFLSQASYPLKGLHQVIKALAMIVNTYPKIQLRIAGENVSNTKTLLSRIKISGYGSYIKKLIIKYKLEKNIIFTGSLTETQMINEYLNAHVFICPSSIENSPNSVGESQILGVPTIASYVGGVPNMITHRESGLLYRFEEVEILAKHIREIFDNENLSKHLSLQGIVLAEQRHNQKNNCDNTIDIYNYILS